jgi:hypothetical protein
MSINEWIAEIQAHRLFVVGATLELESTESLVGLAFGVALELMGIAGIYVLIRRDRFRRDLPALAARLVGLG